jgi:hypothetical protein
MKRYLGLTEQEMSENETMWAEEQGEVDMAGAPEPSLRAAGVTPGGISNDLETAAPPAQGAASEEGGAAQGANALGGAQPGAAAGVAAAPAGAAVAV